MGISGLAAACSTHNHTPLASDIIIMISETISLADIEANESKASYYSCSPGLLSPETGIGLFTKSDFKCPYTSKHET